MKPADQMVARNTNELTVLSYYTTLMRKDMRLFADIWADDAVQEVPFAPEIEGFDPVWKGKEKILAYYNVAIPGRRDHTFWIHEIHQTRDPDCFIVEASAHSVVALTGKAYDQRYVVVFRLREGKIVLMREYVNPLAFMKAFG